MCYDADAAPPPYGPPLTTATATDLVLTSADGTRYDATLALPGRSAGTGVLVLPDNRGLSGFYDQLVVRLAERGHPALALDYFGRTAGTGHRGRGPEFGQVENIMPHLRALTRQTLYADFDAALAHLRAAGDCRRVVSLGFCMGGRFAFGTAIPRFGLAGVIGLYGMPDRLHGIPGPTQLAAEFTAPVLGLFGGADEHITPDVVDAFGAALAGAGVAHEIVTYPGAPHGFFEAGEAAYVDAQVDAWKRITRFLDGASPVAAAH
jgi:carboxymethylenebutenolidase